MNFSKNDLTGLYKWLTSPDPSLFEGNPTRRVFDRYNGNQVLFIINCLLETRCDFSRKEGIEIEKLIINKLPFAASSELTVFNWLNNELNNKSITQLV